MEIKMQPPVKVMYTTVKTTLLDMEQYVGKTPMALKEECERLGLTTNGLQHWVYFGASGDPHNEFELQICLEVEGEAPSDKYQFQELPEFKCVTTMHIGSWDNFAATYEKFVPQIGVEGHTLSNVSREVYLTVDFDNPENNRTEIQVGVV
ncbi:MAG: GyrI-like domain-containing protein [Flavipsychrobacter sp.]